MNLTMANMSYKTAVLAMQKISLVRKVPCKSGNPLCCYNAMKEKLTTCLTIEQCLAQSGVLPG